jgi:hypothetical protein
MRRALRVAALAGALAASPPVLAYLLPPTAVLKRLAQRREQLALASLEVSGMLAASGEAAALLASATGLPLSGSELLVPAVLSIKAPGRCRLELFPTSGNGDRPYVATGRGRLAGGHGLERVPAAVAMLKATCALLGVRSGGTDPGRAYAEELSRLGVSLSEEYLGQMGGRVSYVLGAPPQEKRPQAWIDKQSFQPVRLIATLAGPLVDVRFVDFGSPVGGDAFPRAVEVRDQGALALRLTVEKLAANPKMPDGLFP